MPIYLFGPTTKKNFGLLTSSPVEEAYLKLTPTWIFLALLLSNLFLLMLNITFLFLLVVTFYKFIYLFLERRKVGRQRERETSMCVQEKH